MYRAWLTTGMQHAAASVTNLRALVKVSSTCTENRSDAVREAA
jgi:hypothetical protein